jgi:outer membrane scaffolding protein for murein synthesis (MipA/OmpV family)
MGTAALCEPRHSESVDKRIGRFPDISSGENMALRLVRVQVFTDTFGAQLTPSWAPNRRDDDREDALERMPRNNGSLRSGATAAYPITGGRGCRHFAALQRPGASQTTRAARTQGGYLFH